VFATPELLNQVGPLFIKTVVGLVITGLLGVIMWPFRYARKEWKGMKEEQTRIHEELVQQRANHLTHIERYNKDQVDLLNKVCNVLDGVRLDLREQTGYLKAFTELAPRRRAAAKK
jgi:hypothetical protein